MFKQLLLRWRCRTRRVAHERVLRVLSSAGLSRLSVKAVARIAGLNESTAIQSLRALERRKLVSGSDRDHWFALTGEGHRVMRFRRR